MPAWQGCCLDVALAHPGYPDSPSPSMRIEGLSDEVTILQAGTRRDDQGQLWTAGGRVLHLVCQAESYEVARDKVYAAAAQITFDGKSAHYRKDIGLTLAGRL
ncbi:MAG: phosphoribosylglycinamide synthetase C domain-containing protein [Verrucomicrobiota bacterium]